MVQQISEIRLRWIAKVKGLGAVLLACAAVASTFAQMPQVRPSFEVASIKPYERPYYSYEYTPGGGFRATLPVEWLIAIAYDIRPFERIVDEPRWVRTEYFEIEAKPAMSVSHADTNAMLRTLIEDRFGLMWRNDPSGKAVVYALMMARDDRRLGPGVRPSELACIKDPAPGPLLPKRQLVSGAPVPCGTANTGRLFAGGGITPRVLAQMIQLAMGGEVVDRTGLTGNLDFYLELPDGRNLAGQDAGVSIFTALQEQLGMKLQPTEVTRDLFVVERISRPTPN